MRAMKLNRPGRGTPKIRPVEHRAHGLKMMKQLEEAFSSGEEFRRDMAADIAELRANGTILTLEGEGTDYPLKIDSLESFTRHQKTTKQPKWLLLSVQEDTDAGTERATVWVADKYRSAFLKKFEDYIDRQTELGYPLNRELVANISRIRGAVLKDLWQSAGDPPNRGLRWWELWLDKREGGAENLSAFADKRGQKVLSRSLVVPGRTIVWIKATWDDLQVLPFIDVPLAEIRLPSFVDTIEDLSVDEQEEYVEDLAQRIEAATEKAPAVCMLDTGIIRSHRLLAGSIRSDEVHSVLGESGADREGHGTQMAGLSLFGALDPLLSSSAPVMLRHRLESVRIVPYHSEKDTAPVDYGTVTADAIALAEIASSRDRVYSMPVSTAPDNPGQPTLWSSTVDALAAGTPVVREGEQLRLLGVPDPEASRLIIVSAGNVDSYCDAQASVSDTSVIQDPGQAWNALTVGAFTDMVDVPAHPDYQDWYPIAVKGALSPHSCTSQLFGKQKWPIKPDVCLEGGNVLTDGAGSFEPNHPLLSLRTTGSSNDSALTSANATSAATAQAARLAALVVADYPNYWPETVRGLLAHSAEWTPTMRSELDAAKRKGDKLPLLRRYGWGVPSEETVLHSSKQAVTMVVQDDFVPFTGKGHVSRTFRLHSLPWPSQVLESLFDADVTLRVTLSYFVEPSASRRGWRQKYSYPSHQLRFELKSSAETDTEFINRVNMSAKNEEETGLERRDSSPIKWTIGPLQRNTGSLHQDFVEMSGVELADCGALAVYPVGGWWKKNKSKDRINLPVRYSLIVSLKTKAQGIDLYTPVLNALPVPVSISG